MWQRMQTYVFVTLISVLIWLYAEGESLDTKTFSMDIQFVSAGVKAWIDPTQPTRTPEVTFKGPRWRMSQVAERLRTGAIQLQLTADPTGQNIDQTIDLKQRLSEMDVFAGLGVTIDSVEPPTQKVQVEAYVFRTLPILAMLEGNVRIKYTIEPAQARVGVPTRYAQATEGADANVLAILSIDDPPLNKQIIEENVALSFSDLVPAPLVIIEPANATVTLSVTSANADSKPQSLPVDIRYPLAEISKYEFSFDDAASGVARNVVLNGPEEVIQKIDEDVEARKTLIKAFVQMGAQDLAEAANSDERKTLEVEFDLPPNVIVAQPPRPISFKVKRRPAAAINVEEPIETP